MAKKKIPHPQGEIRRSQLITTYGPGALLDLPDQAVIMSGVDSWWFKVRGEPTRIYEERLSDRVQRLLELDHVELISPPVDDDAPGQRDGFGVRARIFPEWFIAQIKPEQNISFGGKTYRTRPLVHWRSLQKRRYVDRDGKKHPVVPIRFVQACVNGHISDLDWHAFVHNTPHPPRQHQLWLDEGSSSGDLGDIFVRCPRTGARRVLSNATLSGVLGFCKGHRPWLGPQAQERCVGTDGETAEFNRLMIRNASNTYFSQVLSVISIPDPGEPLQQAIAPVYDTFLKDLESFDDLRGLVKILPKVKIALTGFSLEDVWAEIERRRGKGGTGKKIKQAEIETLTTSDDTIGNDIPEGDFFARQHPLTNLSPAFQTRLSHVVLVHRLREVRALVGFTRFEAVVPDIDGELALEVRRAALAQDMATRPWIPAVELRGEGVFLGFRPQAIQAWRKQSGVVARGERLEAGFDAWRVDQNQPQARFPGLEYVMLHTLAHLLITSVSLTCGYGSSAIRERIYASASGYGILLYTGSPGADGTLGGLVQVGTSIEDHLDKAIDMARLCSNDPVCAQHTPDSPYEARYLHGAACHGCVLIAEPSCERRNHFLDRALVVPTVATPDAAFFR